MLVLSWWWECSCLTRASIVWSYRRAQRSCSWEGLWKQTKLSKMPMEFRIGDDMTCKLLSPFGLLQFCCLWKITLCLSTPNYNRNQVTTWIMYMKKNIMESQDRRNFESICMLFVICTHITTLHSCYNFALGSHENDLTLSQSEAGNFFMCIIIRVKQPIGKLLTRDLSQSY